MSIFNSLDYIKNIKILVENRKNAGFKTTYSELAEQMNIQKAYFSRVLGGHAHLSSDQLFAFCEIMSLNEEQTKFLMLLLEHTKSSNHSRKKKLLLQIKEMQKSFLDIKRHTQGEIVQETQSDTSLSDYYHDPFVAIVYTHLMIPSYASNIGSVKEKLSITQKHLEKILVTLTNLRLVQFNARTQAYEVLNSHIHLNKGSLLSQVADQLIRMDILNRLTKLNRDDYFSYTLTFAASDETRATIHQKMLSLIKESEKEIGKSASEKVYNVQMGLIPI